jgi:hypothetical protein
VEVEVEIQGRLMLTLSTFEVEVEDKMTVQDEGYVEVYIQVLFETKDEAQVEAKGQIQVKSWTATIN